MKTGAGRVEGGLWQAAWRELIKNDIPEVEAEAFFQKIQSIRHPNGSNVFRVRASEGRKAFAHGLTDKDDALYLLSEFPYHQAMKRIPNVTSRGAPTDRLKLLRDQINEVLAEMDEKQLQEMLKTLRSGAKRR